MSVTVGSSLASQIGIVVVLAHAFGVKGMGEYGYHYAIASFFGLVSVFGFPIYLQRELSARPSEFERIHSDALSFKLLLDGVLLLLALLLPVVFELPNLTLFYLLYAARITMAYNMFFLVEFRVISAFKIESILTVAGNSLYFLLALLTAYLTSNLVFVAASLLLAQLIVLIIVIARWRRSWNSPLLQFSLCRGYQTFRTNLPYALDQGLAEFLGHMIAFLIGFSLGESALGIFQAGQRIANGVLSFASIVMGAFISSLSGLWASNRILFRDESDRVSVIFGLMGLFSLCLFSYCGSFITEILYTSEFSQLNELWPLFGGYVAVRFLASVPGILLTAAGMQKIRVVVNVASVVLILCFFNSIAGALGLVGVLLVLACSQLLILLSYKICAHFFSVRSFLNRYDMSVYVLFVGVCLFRGLVLV